LEGAIFPPHSSWSASTRKVVTEARAATKARLDRTPFSLDYS
jgi:hypothetical protein